MEDRAVLLRFDIVIQLMQRRPSVCNISATYAQFNVLTITFYAGSRTAQRS